MLAGGLQSVRGGAVESLVYEDLLGSNPEHLSAGELADLTRSLQRALQSSLRVSQSLATHLQDAEQELEDTARLLSHDIRGPIRQFSSFTSLLDASSSDLPDQAAEYISHIKASTELLSERIEGVVSGIRLRGKMKAGAS